MNDKSSSIQQQKAVALKFTIKAASPSDSENDDNLQKRDHHGDLVEKARKYMGSVLGKRKMNEAERLQKEEERERTPLFVKASDLEREDRWDWLWEREFERVKQEELEEELYANYFNNDDSQDNCQVFNFPKFANGAFEGHDIDESVLFCNE